MEKCLSHFTMRKWELEDKYLTAKIVFNLTFNTKLQKCIIKIDIVEENN